jgi:arylsulfatase A-like enzyme
MSRPNLLYVFADQMRARDMACAGNPDVSTPNLDRLAAEGVRFVNGTSCMPVCTPARACLLTGRYPLSTGMFLNDLQLSTAERSIGHVLGDAGYETAWVGKWHLDGGRRWAFTPPGPRRQGFARWHAVNCDHRDYLDPIYYEGDDPTPIRPGAYATEWETEVACRWLREMTAPWCLFLSWSTPHNPYHQLPGRWQDVYDPASLTLPANTPDTETHRRDLAGYYAHISALDETLGRLLAALQASGQADNTIVVFTSDHGDMLGAQGVYRKQWPYDESALVPMIVRWPQGLASGEVSRVPFGIEDSAPTLLSWMGVEPAASMETRDLTGAIAGTEAAPTSSVLLSIAPFSENRGRAWRGVRTATHTYARDEDGPWLLFDNAADPDQLHNLLDEPGAATLRADLETELAGWLERLQDPFLEPAAMIARYGYDVESGRAAPYTYDLETELPVQRARRRQDL